VRGVLTVIGSIQSGLKYRRMKYNSQVLHGSIIKNKTIAGFKLTEACA
jgi:hypothetical protein